VQGFLAVNGCGNALIWVKTTPATPQQSTKSPANSGKSGMARWATGGAAGK
jgi:hypothetical protein